MKSSPHQTPCLWELRRQGALLLLFMLLTASAWAALPFVEPFADARSSGGSSYSLGSPLAGQTNSGNAWVSIGSNNQTAVEPVLSPGNLSYANLPVSSGNCISFFASAGRSARLNLNATVLYGRAYYSMLLKLSELSAVSTAASDNFICCFSDDPSAQTSVLQRGGAKLLTRRSGAGFVLGIGKSIAPADFVYDSTVHATNEVLLVIAAYERTATGTVASLWVNPSPTSFGNVAAPAPTVVCTSGTDHDINANGVRAFVVACQNPNAPSGQMDEVRIGTDWRVVTSSQRGSRPNILFILCDDLGYGDLGVLFQNGRAAGQPRQLTPQLDRFAAEGIQLRQHYCPAPICAPSRSSLMLGVHQGHANVRDTQWDKALANNHTVGTMLKAAGYATALIGKWGLQGDGTSPATWPAYPTKRGFDYYFGYVRHGDGHEHYPKEALYTPRSKECYDGVNNVTPTLDKCYTTDLFTARAKKWIVDHQARHAGQPFFLYLAYDTPHSVYELPTQAYPAGGGTNGGLQWLGTSGQMLNTASGTVDSFVHPDYANATFDHDNNPLTAQVAWPEVFKRFGTAVRRLDDAVGDLKQLLRDLAIETNTLVVFTSDNGPTVEDALTLSVRYSADFFDNFGPFDGVKADCWEGGIRVPTFVRWPGKVPANATNCNASQFHDWMPTFAEVAQVPAPARTDGVSLMPTLLGQTNQRPSTIYVEFLVGGFTPGYSEFEPSHRERVRNQMQVIRLGGLQGVRYNIASASDDFEIYNVPNDPKETTNLALNPAFAPLQQQMKERVLQMRRPEADSPRPYDNELVPAVAQGPLAPGVEWVSYTGAFSWVPDFSPLTPVAAGTASGLSLSVRPRNDEFGLRFSGLLRVPADGDYTFYMSTDTGALLHLHDALLLDADAGYVAGSEVSDTIKLKAGLHPFRLDYARATAGVPALSLAWSGPGLSRQALPESALFRAIPQPRLTVAGEPERLVLDWSGPFILQASTNVAGPYLDLPNQTVPYTNPVNIDTSQRFFRLRQ